MNIKNLCIIEDDRDIADSVKTYMEASGFKVFLYHSAEEFYSHQTDDFYGIYLIDWNLPGEPGIEVVKKIRAEDKISPVFILSANNQKEEIIEGLKSGADDYMTKPFSFEELMARINNASAKFELMLQQSQLDNFRLLPEAAAFIKDGQTVNLTSREYIIFDYLVQKTGQPVSRDELIHCFANDDKMTNRNVDVHIFSLRKKLKSVSMHIETVWGKGYKLV